MNMTDGLSEVSFSGNDINPAVLGLSPEPSEDEPREPRVADPDLVKAVFESIAELDPRHNLPRSEIFKIAEDAVLADRVTDGEWVYNCIQESKKEFSRKRNIAKVRGYAPFTCLSQRIYLKLKDRFGEDMLEFMKNYLLDPEDIYTKWSYRFAYTVEQIGREECLLHRDEIYPFVTTHPLWEQGKEKCFEEFAVWIAA